VLLTKVTAKIRNESFIRTQKYNYQFSLSSLIAFGMHGCLQKLPGYQKVFFKAVRVIRGKNVVYSK